MNNKYRTMWTTYLLVPLKVYFDSSRCETARKPFPPFLVWVWNALLLKINVFYWTSTASTICIWQRRNHYNYIHTCNIQSKEKHSKDKKFQSGCENEDAWNHSRETLSGLPENMLLDLGSREGSLMVLGNTFFFLSS